MERMLTRKEFARLVSVSPSTVARWEKKGKITSARAGRLVRIPESELEKLFTRTCPPGRGVFLPPSPPSRRPAPGSSSQNPQSWWSPWKVVQATLALCLSALVWQGVIESDVFQSNLPSIGQASLYDLSRPTPLPVLSAGTYSSPEPVPPQTRRGGTQTEQASQPDPRPAVPQDYPTTSTEDLQALRKELVGQRKELQSLASGLNTMGEEFSAARKEKKLRSEAVPEEIRALRNELKTQAEEIKSLKAQVGTLLAMLEEKERHPSPGAPPPGVGDSPLQGNARYGLPIPLPSALGAAGLKSNR